MTQQEIDDQLRAALAAEEAERESKRQAKIDLQATWLALPLEVRAGFAPIRAAVYVAIDDGDFELAHSLVVGAVVPPELEATKQTLLGFLG